CVLQHGFKYRLELAGRAADDTEDLRSRGLLLQCLAQIICTLAQLVEQARVVDRDDRLRGKIRHQFDLLLPKRTNLLSMDGEGPAYFVTLEHRHSQCGPRSAVNGNPRRSEGWRDIDGTNIGNMDRTLHLRDLPEAGARPRTDNRSAAAFLRQPWWRTVQCGDAVFSFPLPQVQHAELGVAEPRRVRQYGLEHGLKVAGRARDEAQHLIGRRLLLQRLGKVPPRLRQLTGARFELLFNSISELGPLLT